MRSGKWLVVALAAMALSTVAHAEDAHVATVCHVRWSTDGLPGPDGRTGCTPGHYQRMTRAEACVHRDRPDTPRAVRREVLGEYGVPRWSGRDGELDHRVPFFLGGRSDAGNLWPEPGPIPNSKDRLERAVYDRLCSWGDRMTLKAARKVFTGDWRKTYREWWP